MPPPRRRVSPAVWVVLLVLVALAAIAAERSAQMRQITATLPPPRPLPAPKPPTFAFNIPPRPVAQPQPVHPQPASPKPVAAKPEKLAVAKPAQPASPPQDVQRRADKAFGETQPGGAFTGLDNRPGYIWVGRFEREDRAHGAAKKIEDLGGLSARVVPRQNESGKFFVVWTGPFAAKSLPGILDWLQAQGFAKARAVRTPGNGMTGLRDQGQNGEPWRKANPAPNP
jgi:hypothetical protein